MIKKLVRTISLAFSKYPLKERSPEFIATRNDCILYNKRRFYDYLKAARNTSILDRYIK